MQSNPFQNLGFEEVNRQVLPPGGVGTLAPIANLLPGWQAFLGATELTTIGYNYLPELPGPGFVTIFDSLSGTSPFAGNFGLSIRENFENAPPIWVQQRGDIPSFAQRLIVTLAGLPLGVQIDGQPLNVVSVIGSGASPTLMPTTVEYDLTPFTGRQNALLTIGPAPDPFGNQNGTTFDNIFFAVPEPGTASLFALGAVGLVWQLWRLRRKQNAPAAASLLHQYGSTRQLNSN
ncbi:MAG: PEP-CTERM sorting domain-containing protein [Verrucomicrobia bacterium]|nr:PEP-CTERM sorting domain-containing protein [Verrucomicrobiota bacterium]